MIGAVADRLSGHRGVEFHVVAPEVGDLNRHGITLHQGLTDASLRALYQDADVLLLPLRAATANNALLEGMASGLPVISTRLPAVHTYLGSADAILVECGDADACADAVEALADDADRRATMGRASRRRALELDWRHIAKQYEDVYRS